MPRKTLVTSLLQRYWRLSRGLTLGAQGCVVDSQGRILLIRHTYRPGWHFPGGGVEKDETVHAALTRELAEEAGIMIDGPPELFGIYANFNHFPGDHIALFVIRHWRQTHVPTANSEIAEQGFFAFEALPADINRATGDRIREVLGSAGRADLW